MTSWNTKGAKPTAKQIAARSVVVRGHSSRPGRSEKRFSKWPKIPGRPGSAALLQTCHQVRNETLHLLYGQITFLFTSQTIFQRFLTTLSPSCLSAIRSIKLRHMTYGEPLMTADKPWKERYDAKWAHLCHLAADTLTDLREFEVQLSINDWPTTLHLNARWALPLLQFAGRSLRMARVGLQINGRCMDPKDLRACAAVLERELVCAEARAEFVRTQKRRNGELPRARRCLRIT